jgi:succinyldiaminopimelate transaminase
VRLSPILAELGTYPFVRLTDAKARLAAQGVSFVDFGIGDPREPVEPFIRRALVDNVEERMGYPLAQGLPELRQAVAAWCLSRFGVELDPDTEVLPTLGSKEAIFSLAQVVLDPVGGKDLVVVTEPGYPVQERGALFAGGRVLQLPLLERNGFLPDLDSVPGETWRRLAVFWVNYPNNPTGAVAPLSFYERLAALAVEHDFLLASDEAYTELYFGEPPPSALQLPSRRNVAVFNTLSKRSSMTGYRSGFVAGDPELIGALRAFRPTVGTAPQEFVQHAAIAAWGDEGHVERMRDVYRRKREILLEVLEEKGIRVAGGEATMYLWLEVPGGGSSEAFATGLLEHGVVIAPGSFFGPAGEGYVRIALVPTEDECHRAAAILREVL